MVDQQPLFNFKLCSIENASVFGRHERHRSWFWLTDGWFWLSAGEAELLRYADPWLQAHEEPIDDPPYVDYYVVRLWEDVLELFPETLEPIPSDLWERARTPDRAAAWEQAAERRLEASEEESDWDVYYTAVAWYGNRKLATVPIQPSPGIWFLRVGDTIRVRWDTRQNVENGVPVWSASVGEYDLSVDAFVAEVTSFHDRLMAQMRQRIDSAVEYWPCSDVQIDLPRLLREHADRDGALRAALARPPSATDWDQVRQALTLLDL